MLVRLPPVEDRCLGLPGAAEQSERQYAERNVRCVLPVMAEWRKGIAGRGWAVRKGNRADCGFANRRDVERQREIVRDGMLVERGDLHEEIVRMLPIVERRATVALARLQQQRIS